MYILRINRILFTAKYSEMLINNHLANITRKVNYTSPGYPHNTTS